MNASMRSSKKNRKIQGDHVMSNEMLLGVGVILFIILFIPILKTVKCMPLFKESPVIMALVITALCIVALYETLVVPPAQRNTDDKKPTFLFILIPYAALALTILIILLVRFLRKHAIGGNLWKNKKYNEGMYSNTHIPKECSRRNKFIQKLIKQNSNLMKEK
jgi:hypothetical protein